MGSISRIHSAHGASPEELQPRLVSARAIATARRTSAYLARRPAARKAKTRNSVAVLRKRLREAWLTTVKAARTWQAIATAVIVVATATAVWVPGVFMVKRSAVTSDPADAFKKKEVQQPDSGPYPTQKEGALQLKLSVRISSSSTDQQGETK